MRSKSPVERLRRSHQPDHRRRCRADAQLWPCDVALLIKIVDTIVDDIRTDRHPEDRGLSYNDGWNDALDSIQRRHWARALLDVEPVDNGDGTETVTVEFR